MKYPVKNNYFTVITAFLILTLIIPTISAAASDDKEKKTAIITIPELNVTKESLTNRTIPDEYQITPDPIKVQIELNRTLLPASKGEMAVGPRTIGFSIAPASFIIMILTVCAIVTGILIISTKNSKEDKEE